MILELLGLFIAALALILAAAVLFTNGVEWLGRRFELSEGGVGSVLAAVGTALPETVIPLVAILWMGGDEAVEVGIGAILGAPFMLVTLTLPLTGIWILFLYFMGQRKNSFEINYGIPSTDLGYFLPAYSLAIMAWILSYPALKILVALILVGLYIRYLIKILGTGEVSEAPIGPLYFSPSSKHPALFVILIQVFVALGIMVSGAYLFVDIVKQLAPIIGISPLILSLLVTPVATELPEKFNSLVWVSQKKDSLAVGNITGAMVFQGTIPVSIGLVATSWKINHLSLVCAVLAILMAWVYWMMIKKNKTWKPWHIAMGAIVYLGFGMYVWLKM